MSDNRCTVKHSLLISVIIPVYNVREWLKECIESVICQTYKNIEIIIVDDESTDGSEVISEKYALKDKRISVIHKKHSGLSATRNVGIEHANGDVIVFLDSDDVMNEYALEKIESIMQNQSIQVLAFGVEDYNSGTSISNPPQGIYNRTDILMSIVNNCGIAKAIWTKAFRASAIRDIRFIEGHNYVDVSFFLKVIDNCGTIKVIDDQLIRYRIRTGSITTSNNKQNYIDNINQNEMMCDYCKQYNVNGCLDKVIDKLETEKTYCMLGMFIALYKDKKNIENQVLRSKILDDILCQKSRINNSYIKFSIGILRLSPRGFIFLNRFRRACLKILHFRKNR